MRKSASARTVKTDGGGDGEKWRGAGKVDVATAQPRGNGPVGFAAALLPFLQDRDAQAVQRQNVADHFPGDDAYFSYVLTLFGQGWDEHRFRFTSRGELQPDWGRACASSQ